MERETAIRWFVNRFIHTEQARDFVLQTHNLKAKTADKRSRWSQYVERNQRYMLDFQQSGRYLLIIPTTSAAHWAAGKIWESQTGFHYRSLQNKTLFNQEDQKLRMETS